ncbi:prepilin peptidase [Sphingomonas yantingensis]|uniref:Prepilin leader peptidase/N-methyltransferase n=1 Tax=Sphingomonas yantingensis TaxID=1241761 RepID=A0A7W9ASF3_9SPHN|nr:A24 family peptidase [Sphingomonas yantingensis]MBB5699738.1 leader peptidase (prepilin peptidase)/N-methyltransferase [Sphingomonas yantingensis]
MVPPLLWPVLLGVLGAVFGSFIAVIAIRWPAGGRANGRSRCDACGVELRARELVPLLSFLIQRGRCRHCGARIGRSHVVIEALGLAIGIVAGAVAPGIEGVAGAVLGWLLLALGAIDFAALWLPNRMVAALALAGLASGAIGLPPSWTERLIGGAAGFGVLWLVAALYRRVRGRMGLGGGDPKLFGAIGLWLGWRALPGVLLAACVIGLAWAVATRMRGDSRLPLGTLLAAAAWLFWVGAALA